MYRLAACGTFSGCRTSAFSTLNTIALAPIPSASVTTAASANPGDLRNCRIANRMSLYTFMLLLRKSGTPGSCNRPSSRLNLDPKGLCAQRPIPLSKSGAPCPESDTSPPAPGCRLPQVPGAPPGCRVPHLSAGCPTLAASLFLRLGWGWPAAPAHRSPKPGAPPSRVAHNLEMHQDQPQIRLAEPTCSTRNRHPPLPIISPIRSTMFLGRPNHERTLLRETSIDAGRTTIRWPRRDADHPPTPLAITPKFWCTFRRFPRFINEIQV